MNPLIVNLPGALVLENFPAILVLANKLLPSGDLIMNLLMGVQIALLVELFVAYEAHVRPYACVDPLVHFKIGLMIE